MELQSNALSIEHIKNLDEALEDSEKGPAANHVQNMKCYKDARSLDQRMKYIEGEIQKSGTPFVTLILNYGTVEEINQKVPLGKKIMKETRVT